MYNPFDRLAAWWIDRRYEANARRMGAELTELGIKRLDATRGGWEATFVTPAAAMIANEMAAMLDAASAENYLTFDFLPRLDRDDARPVRVTVQWARGKNPGTIVEELKARVAELERQLETRHATE